MLLLLYFVIVLLVYMTWVITMWVTMLEMSVSLTVLKTADWSPCVYLIRWSMLLSLSVCARSCAACNPVWQEEAHRRPVLH